MTVFSCGITAALCSWLLLGSSYVSEAKSSSLLPSARRLEDGSAAVDTSYFAYDLSEFSVRFEKCQYVKMYDDELAEDEDSTSPLAMRHFVAFRMCPSDDCDSCDSVYGKYVVDVETYLESTVQNQANALETLCENCQDRCNTDDDSCSDCGRLCYTYENFENDGYIDASTYMECQQVQQNDDNNGQAYYIGPRCSNDGEHIRIGVFSDYECFEPVSDVDVEDIIGAPLSYHLLRHTYSASTTGDNVCLSCMEDDGNQNENDQADADDVNEMCEELYNSAAKCESDTGITSGFIQTNKDDNDYENQVENEAMSCTFINSLLWNSYTETGEIDISSPQDVYLRKITNNQAIMLTVLFLTFGGLLAAMKFLEHKVSLIPTMPLSVRGDPSMT